MSSNKQPRSRILTRSGTKAVQVLRPEIDEGIDAFGLTALVGYEAEVNHCAGLCTATYSDYHFHMALASTDTYIYRTRRKHRLMYACKKGNVKWFSLLWKAGSIEDMINLRGGRYGGQNLGYHLLDNAEEDRGDPHQDTLNRVGISRIVFDSPIKPDDMYEFWYDSIDEPLLHLAIKKKNLPLANELLKYPEFIDPDGFGYNPPIFAVAKNDFWEFGIKLAALPNVKLDSLNYEKRSALQIAVENNSKQVIERVFLPHQDRIGIINHFYDNFYYRDNEIQDNEPVTVLEFAIRKGYNDLIPLLCSFRNIDLHDEGFYGSPLHLSVKMENLEAVRLLLACQDRINVNLATEERFPALVYGQTALALACEFGYLEIVQTLLSFPNIDINTKDSYHNSPLHTAVMAFEVEIVKALVQDPTKCDVNIQNEDGHTPLHYAVYGELDFFADYEAYTLLPRGNNISSRQRKIVRILAAVPTINFNLKNNDDKTVVDIAMGKFYYNPKIVKELVQYKDRFDESVREKYNLLSSESLRRNRSNSFERRGR